MLYVESEKKQNETRKREKYFTCKILWEKKLWLSALLYFCVFPCSSVLFGYNSNLHIIFAYIYMFIVWSKSVCIHTAFDITYEHTTKEQISKSEHRQQQRNNKLFFFFLKNTSCTTRADLLLPPKMTEENEANGNQDSDRLQVENENAKNNGDQGCVFL